MTATATRIVTTHRPTHGFAELRVLPAVLVVSLMSLVLSALLAMSVVGAARSGLELPAPGPIPQPLGVPATGPAAPSIVQPETAPAGLDL